MLKKALVSAGIAALALGASAGFASAAPADTAKPLPDTKDICNAPVVSNPDHEDSWTGLIEKDNPLNSIVSAILKDTKVVVGVCNDKQAKAKDQGGDEGKGDQGQGSGDQGQGDNGQGGSDVPGQGGEVPGQDGGSFPGPLN